MTATTIENQAESCVEKAVKGYTHNNESSEKLFEKTKKYLTSRLLELAYGETVWSLTLPCIRVT